MYFTLARALGMTVREMLSRMDAAELAEWLAYMSVEPIGDDRIDLAAGILATIMSRLWSQSSLRPTDLIPDYWRGRSAQSLEEMQALFRAIGRKK